MDAIYEAYEAARRGRELVPQTSIPRHLLADDASSRTLRKWDSFDSDVFVMSKKQLENERPRVHPFVEGMDGLCWMCRQPMDVHLCCVSPRVQASFQVEAPVDSEKAQLQKKQEQEKKKMEELRKVMKKKETQQKSSALEKNVLMFVSKMKFKNKQRKLKKKQNTASSLTENCGLPKFSESYFMNHRLRSIHRSCLWHFQDICDVLHIQARNLIACAALVEGEDLETHVVAPGDGTSTVLLNDKGLLKIALRTRNQRANKLHSFCMETRTKLVSEESHGAGGHSWDPEELTERNIRERTISLNALNPEKVVKDAMQLLFKKSDPNDARWRHFGYTKLHKFPIFTQTFAHLEKHKSFVHIKSTCELDASPQAVYQLLMRTNKWSTWDTTVDQVTTVDKVNANTDILHLKLGEISPLDHSMLRMTHLLSQDMVKPRDFAVIRQVKDSYQEYVILLHSISWKDCPPVRTHVRAKMYSSGFLIRAALHHDGHPDKNRTELTMIYVMDLQTQVPDFLRQHIIQTKCACLDQLQEITSMSKKHG